METRSSLNRGQDEQQIIILHIEEGVGLNQAEAILMQASLSGNKLEAEPIKPGHTTLFDCNLVWETDRKSIKRMKTENLPVKIDCYALRNFKGRVEEATKEHVGYILCPVKNIPIVPVEKALQIKARWVKLIGLSKDWRQHKPEFLMNIMITSSDYLTVDKSQLLDSHGLESSDSVVIEENPVPCMLTSQRGIFIRLLKEEGLLQVGNIDTNCDIFTVKILMKNIRFLENIKFPKVGDSDSEYFVNYGLLGNQHTRELDKKFNRIYQVHEKVSINFRSSLAALQEYFEKIFFIPFEVMTASKVIGNTEIRANRLINITNLKEFLEKYPSAKCELEEVCTFNTQHELRADTSRPVLECKMVIQYMATKKLHQTECLDNYKRLQEIDSAAGGDYDAQPSVKPLKQQKNLSDIPEVRSESEKSHTQKSFPAPQKLEPKKVTSEKFPVSQSEKIDIDSILNTSQSGNSSELPRLFSYNLQLCSIKFNRKAEKGNLQFSFFHDKADTPLTFINREIRESDISEGNEIVFDNFELKLYFTSHANEIMELIRSSNVCLLCVKGPRLKLAKAELDCNSLLIGNKEKSSGIVLLQDQSEQIVAMAKISANLDDLGINFNSQFKVIQGDKDTNRFEINETRTIEEQKMMIFDDCFSYKMIEELDEWKKHQQETFIVDLKRKESQLLDRLKTDWNTKKSQYEHELVMKSDKLTSLTKSLEDLQKSLKTKDNQQIKDNHEIHDMKQELEKAYNNQVMAIRERARRMEDDLLHEMKVKDIRFEDMERCNKHLKAENFELLQKMECLRAELMEVKANLIPKEDVEKLLQEMRLLKEKCEELQQSKLFYKEQWAKTFRECHQIRRENVATVKQDIFRAKCDRLCDALNEHDLDMNIDKEELEKLKDCLNLSDNEV